ncbi:MAG TPA: hypothetical protein VLB00_16050 [Gemmatimonadales bacterium]|nr:hypothetical protein [Gemmatimonadales bacterium]
MRIQPSQVIRFGLTLLTAAVAVGCKDDGDDITDPGAIALALNPTSASVAQGGNTTTTATLTRSGGFTGSVTLSVTGAPSGVTAAISNIQTTGAVTTATVTVTVGAAVAAATYPLVVRGTGSGVTEATANFALTVTAAPVGSYTLSLSSAALGIAQGASTPTTTVNVNRTNFSGDVQLAVTGLPAGVTAAFVPNPATGASSVLTLTVGAAVPAQVYNLTVTGTASVGNQSTPLALTVTAAVAGNFTLSTTPATSASVVQGASTNVTVNLARTGGFAGGVNLTATGLPAGLTAAFNPTSPTGATSTLTLTATAGLAVGAYPIVIRGNFTGLAEQTVNLTVNVTPSGGGSGNVTVSFAACAVADRAVWVAFQDGTAGAWTRVTGTNDVYQFNITSGKGGVAWVVLGTGTSTINVQYFSQAEMTAGVQSFCGAAAVTGKTVNATVANLPGGAQGRVSFGGGFAATVANGPVQLTNVLDGSQDLVAYAGQLLGPGGTDRVFLARGLNPANGGSLGTVDFTGTGSFAVTPGTITLAGGAGGEIYSQAMFYLTGPSCVTSVLYPIGTFSASPFTAYGIGSANQAATDLHRLTVTAILGTTDIRLVTEDFKNIGNRTLTLPSALGAVTASNAGGPYKRPMLVTTFPAELNSSAVMTFSDQTVAGKGGAITATAAWLGGLNVSLTLPDFSALSGWSNAWAPATGDQVNWTLSGSGTNLTSGCQEGGRLASSTKTGTI